MKVTSASVDFPAALALAQDGHPLSAENTKRLFDAIFTGRLSEEEIIAYLSATADRKPTVGSLRMYGELKARLDGIVREYQALMEKDIADFNRAAEEAKLPRVAPAPKIEK